MRAVTVENKRAGAAARANVSSRVFGAPWSPWIGGLLVGVVSIVMVGYLRPWGVFAGVRLGGEWLLKVARIPAFADAQLPGIIVDPTMVMNMGLFAGALAAALLSRQFAIRVPVSGGAVLGVVGGTGMGLGAQLAGGCNIGAFFTPFGALAVGGFGMMLGMFVGAWIGTKLFLLVLPRLPMRGGGTYCGVETWGGRQPAAGILILALGLFAALVFYPNADLGQFGLEPTLGMLLLAGLVLGIVLQRSRFCFVAAFRDLFMTREAHMIRAAVVALAVAVVGVTALTWLGVQAPYAYSFGWETLVGGVIFGISMIFAGGCASSSLWRAGEGHLQLWLTLLAFGVSGAITKWALDSAGFERGRWVYLPDIFGGGQAGLLLGATAALVVLAIWWAIGRRVESRPIG